MDLRMDGSQSTSKMGPANFHESLRNEPNLLQERTQYLIWTLWETSNTRPVASHWNVPSHSRVNLHRQHQDTDRKSHKKAEQRCVSPHLLYYQLVPETAWGCLLTLLSRMETHTGRGRTENREGGGHSLQTTSGNFSRCDKFIVVILKKQMN